MNVYAKVGLVGALLLLGGCATMGSWTPGQTAAFVGAMQATANAVDPWEYAGPRQAPQPAYVPEPEAAPAAQAYEGRPYRPSFPASQPITPPAPPAQIGANLSTPIHCTVGAYNEVTCN